MLLPPLLLLLPLLLQLVASSALSSPLAAPVPCSGRAQTPAASHHHLTAADAAALLCRYHWLQFCQVTRTWSHRSQQPGTLRNNLFMPLPLLLLAVGSIIGFALAFGGTGAVQWARQDPCSFPPYRGIVPIVLSWTVSPVLTGAVAAAVFGLTRWLVLRRERAAKLAFWVLPPAVLVTVMINVFFVCECHSVTRLCLHARSDKQPERY
jgi:hypothetical protein